MGHSDLMETLQAIAQTTEDTVVALDAGGTFLFADPEVLHFLGRGPEELGRFCVEDVLGRADVAWAARMVGRMYADAPVGVPEELRLTAQGRGVLRFAVYTLKYEDPSGEVAFIAFLRAQAAS